ncbi:MAG: hypothetical protein LUD46_19780 [Parabacteroides sp.]|nr:hypothetical protein [Parabacteroides sp.]
MQRYFIHTSHLALLFAGLLAACTSEENLPGSTPEMLLTPRLYVGATETRSIVNGTATTASESRISQVKLFVTQNGNLPDASDGHTPYPGIGSGNTAGLSMFTLTTGETKDEWIGSPEVKLSNQVARIFAFSPHDADFTASTSNDEHKIKVTVPAVQTFNGNNTWQCSTTDYLYGSSSSVAGEAANITASNKETDGSPSYSPEISMQHALSLLVFTMQSAPARKVDVTYDYVQKVTLSSTSETPFLVTTAENGGTMLVKDGTLSLGSSTASLVFTPTQNTTDGSGTTTLNAVCCGDAGKPNTVAYGLVSPLSSTPTANLTVTVLLGKQDGSADNQRELSVDLTPKQWLKGNRYAINLTLSDRAVTVNTSTDGGSVTDWITGWNDGDSKGNGTLNPDGFIDNK